MKAVIVAATLCLSALPAAADTLTKAQMKVEFDQTVAMLGQTKAFMTLPDDQTRKAFHENQLEPFKARVNSLSGRKLADADLINCRFYMTDVIKWFGILDSYKAGEISKPEMKRRAGHQKQMMDIHGPACEAILTEAG